MTATAPASAGIALRALPPGAVQLLPSIFQQRTALTRDYLVELRSDNLVQNHVLESGLGHRASRDEALHWGWESPNSLVRGQFLGHWISAAAHHVARTGDPELRGKLEWVIAKLGECQQEAGGEWLSSLPPTYLDRALRGRPTWAVQYVIEKTLSGLLDAHLLLGDVRALDLVVNMARWMHRFTGGLGAEQMADLVDLECGHMMALWASLYGITGDATHRELMERYYRRRQFDALLAGRDVLTNRHANTTIPEACGAARAYEVTGDSTYRQAAEAYWRCAVEGRESFCTGGQNAGEYWVPPGLLPSRLGATTQEHCTVYNMRRLAEHLLRWSGDPAYADYRERALWNGILAQQHPTTGMVTYFLPMRAGSTKTWGSRTTDFWCCHGTLVQANTIHGMNAWYEDGDGLVLAEYVASRTTCERDGVAVTLTLREHMERSMDEAGHVDMGCDVGTARPRRSTYHVDVACERPLDMTLRLRIPWWAEGAEVLLDGERIAGDVRASTLVPLRRTWHHATITVILPRRLVAEPLPGRPDVVSFIEGPVVLAGLCDEERTLHGAGDDPTSLLVPDDEREWERWNVRFRTRDQERGIRFVPLHEVVDERYTLYFPYSAG